MKHINSKSSQGYSFKKYYKNLVLWLKSICGLSKPEKNIFFDLQSKNNDENTLAGKIFRLLNAFGIKIQNQSVINRKAGILPKNYFEINEKNRLIELEKIIASGGVSFDDYEDGRFKIDEFK